VFRPWQALALGSSLFAPGCASNDAERLKASSDAAADAEEEPPSDSTAAVDTHEEVGCDSRACWCERFCEHAVKAACVNDPPASYCNDHCLAKTRAGCEERSSTALRCRAELPQSAYACTPLGTYIAYGCDAEVQAFVDCLDRD
jgi:hypothetical protein